MFATLLANASIGNEDALQQRNLEIVSRMSPADAKLLSIIVDRIDRYPTLLGDDQILFRWREGQFIELAKREHSFDNYISLENLRRIGVLERNPELDNFALNDHLEKLSDAIENKSTEDLSPSFFRDLVEVHYVLELSMSGLSLARALFPDKFKFTKSQESDIAF